MTAPKDDSEEVPSPFSMSDSCNVVSGWPLWNASSLAGRFVRICCTMLATCPQNTVKTYVLLIKDHGPSRPYTGITVLTICHPECPSSLFPVRPVTRRRQCLLNIQTNTVLSVQTHHERQPGSSPYTHPSSGEIHELELMATQESPRLAMCDGNHAFTVASHLVCLSVFSRSRIEMFRVSRILGGDDTCVRPHGISQTYRWSHMGSKVH